MTMMIYADDDELTEDVSMSADRKSSAMTLPRDPRHRPRLRRTLQRHRVS